MKHGIHWSWDAYFVFLMSTMPDELYAVMLSLLDLDLRHDVGLCFRRVVTNGDTILDSWTSLSQLMFTWLLNWIIGPYGARFPQFVGRMEITFFTLDMICLAHFYIMLQMGFARGSHFPKPSYMSADMDFGSLVREELSVWGRDRPVTRFVFKQKKNLVQRVGGWKTLSHTMAAVSTDTGVAIRKDELTDSDSDFSRTVGSGSSPKWRTMATRVFLKRWVSIIFRRAFLGIFEKWDLGFLRKKRRIGDELEVVKNTKMVSVGFLIFRDHFFLN